MAEGGSQNSFPKRQYGHGEGISIADEISAALGRGTRDRNLDESPENGGTYLDQNNQIPSNTESESGRSLPVTFIHKRGVDVNAGLSSGIPDHVSAATASKYGQNTCIQEADDTKPGSFRGGNDGLSETTPLLRRNSTGDSNKGGADGEKPAAHHPWRLVAISLFSLIFSISWKVSDPVLSQYVYQVYTFQVYGNDSVKIPITKQPCVNTTSLNSTAAQNNQLRDTVQDKSADMILYLEILSNVAGMFSCVLLGTYSDVMGRRLSILVPMSGLLLRDITLPVIIHWNLGLLPLYIGYGLYGLCGGTGGLLLGCYVYSADITVSEKQRTMGLALVMASMGFGNMVTQFSAGYFIQETGFFFPSLTAGLLDLSCVLFVLFFLPETVQRDRKQWMTPCESIKRIISTFSSRDNPHQRAVLLLQLLAFFIGVTADYPASKIDPLYLMDQPFCWDSSQIGLVGSIKYGATQVTALLLLLLLQHVLSPPLLAALGAFSFLSSNVVTGLATNDLLVYVGAGAAMATMIMYASIRSMMSRMVPPDRQGALFGGIAVVESVCFAVGQMLFLTIYKAVVGIMPGIVYFAMGGFFLVNIVIFLLYRCLLKRSKLIAVPPANIQSQVIVPATDVPTASLFSNDNQ